MNEIEMLRKETSEMLNLVCKWRMILAGWQLGTRPKTDPECQAVRDQRELLILLRAEQNALLTLLMRKGVFSETEWLETLQREARQMNVDFEARFPGMRASDEGIVVFDVQRAKQTTQGWMP